MVTLPKDFVATRYPGYFFNTKDDKLYSLKIDGVLKPLKLQAANQFNHLYRYSPDGGYQVSVKGLRIIYPLTKLRELKDTDATIPVKETA